MSCYTFVTFEYSTILNYICLDWPGRPGQQCGRRFQLHTKGKPVLQATGRIANLNISTYESKKVDDTIKELEAALGQQNRWCQ
jgi:hypothetical protein